MGSSCSGYWDYKELTLEEIHRLLMNSSGEDLESLLNKNWNKSQSMFNFSEEHALNIFRDLSDNRNLSLTAEVILITIYSFLILGGLVTNILVSFVVARRKQMHTARNLYIVNLTISDISLCLICMPFTLISILRRQWTLGPVLCKLVSFLQGTNIMVSVGTITVIALDRYYTICRKSTQNAKEMRRRVIISILLIWLMSIIATLPLCVYQVRHLFIYFFAK